MDYNVIKRLADERKIEIQEITRELDMTPNGFRACIKNDTIQLKKLRLLFKILQIDPSTFFEDDKSLFISNGFTQVGNNNKIIVENEEKEILSMRNQLFDKIEIIQLLKEKLEFTQMKLNDYEKSLN